MLICDFCETREGSGVAIEKIAVEMTLTYSTGGKDTVFRVPYDLCGACRHKLKDRVSQAVWDLRQEERAALKAETKEIKKCTR